MKEKYNMNTMLSVVNVFQGNPKEHLNRYRALNLQNLFTIGTVECRLKENCKDTREIMAWISLLAVFYCRVLENECVSNLFSPEEKAILYVDKTDDNYRHLNPACADLFFRFIDVPCLKEYWCSKNESLCGVLTDENRTFTTGSSRQGQLNAMAPPQNTKITEKIMWKPTYNENQVKSNVELNTLIKNIIEFDTAQLPHIIQEPSNVGSPSPSFTSPSSASSASTRSFQGLQGQVRPQGFLQGQVRPSQVQPGQVRPGQVQPGQVQPGPVQPGQVQPGQVRPGQVQPGPVQPHGGKSNKKATSKRIQIGKKQQIVYEGPRGGQYVKQNGGFVPIHSIKKTTAEPKKDKLYKKTK